MGDYQICSVLTSLQNDLLRWRGIVMDYLCAEFGDFSFSRFSFIVPTDRSAQNQRRGLSPVSTTRVDGP